MELFDTFTGLTKLENICNCFFFLNKSCWLERAIHLAQLADLIRFGGGKMKYSSALDRHAR